MRHRILLAAALLFLVVANMIWIARDTRPPFWDMALHGTAAVHLYDAVADSGVSALLRTPKVLLETGYPYPPFYPMFVAAAWSLFGRTVDVAELANLIPVALLLLSTYGIGRFVLSPISAVAAAFLVSCYPILLWLSREMLIDYWLAATVTTAIWFLLRTNSFDDRRWSVAFGITAGVGVLTKWTFPFFVALPFLYFARKNRVNAAISAAIAALISAWWYMPAASTLTQFYAMNTAGGRSEGDPGRITWQALLFYIRALEGYQVFAVLFVAFIAGLVLCLRRFDPKWTPILLWIGGGWLGLMLFQNKDPRYSAPLLPAVALITATLFERRRECAVAVIGFALLQHYVVSFGVRSVPSSVVLLRGAAGSQSWDWNLYTQTYFGLWGKPIRQDWKIPYVLDRVTQGSTGIVRLGLVPDIPRFDSLAFNFYIALLKARVQLNRVGVGNTFDNDYVLVSEDSQGFYPFDEPNARPTNDFIKSHPERFVAIEGITLPSGDVIQLYKVQ